MCDLVLLAFFFVLLGSFFTMPEFFFVMLVFFFVILMFSCVILVIGCAPRIPNTTGTSKHNNTNNIGLIWLGYGVSLNPVAKKPPRQERIGMGTRPLGVWG